VSDQANSKRLLQAARRRRNRRRRQARRDLDAAYQAYLREVGSPLRPPVSLDDSRNNITNNNNGNSNASVIIPTSSPPPPPPSQSPLSSQPPSPPCSPTPPIVEPDSPHSVLTLRVRPDTPPRTPSISPPSYSPICSPRPTSPANSTSSVEFVDELHIPPPRPRHYYYYDPNESIETLITQFPQRTVPLPSGSYTIGPDDFELTEIREIIATQDPDSLIPTYLPTSPFPYDVPVRFFYNLFPPSTIIINELPN